MHLMTWEGPNRRYQSHFPAHSSCESHFPKSNIPFPLAECSKNPTFVHFISFRCRTALVCDWGWSRYLISKRPSADPKTHEDFPKIIRAFWVSILKWCNLESTLVAVKFGRFPTEHSFYPLTAKFHLSAIANLLNYLRQIFLFVVFRITSLFLILSCSDCITVEIDGCRAFVLSTSSSVVTRYLQSLSKM